jgi:putative cardiolipin synthase
MLCFLQYRAWVGMTLLRGIGSALVLGCILSACATRTVAPYDPPAEQYALPPQSGGAFAAIESALHEAGDADESGFQFLDRNEDGLRWRLALIDSASYSIDAQYYLWYGDAAGRILLKRLRDAADRGVRVRLLIDDLNTLLSDASTIGDRDKVVAWVDSHPNLELRLFNPWSNRNIAARVSEGAKKFEQLNQRMHNKALIVDNRAVILGGRNVGDEYMGLSSEFNFHDIDVLGVGPVARQTSVIFDQYWNSNWVMPVSALRMEISADELAAGAEALKSSLTDDPSLENFPLEPQSWLDALEALPASLHLGTSRVESDLPGADGIEQVMLEELRSLMRAAQSELSIVNAYIIPTDTGIAILNDLASQEVEVSILTNSLASHDVPAVNSHYKRWRKPILESGASLYELRHDAKIQASVSDTPPTRAKFIGLHSKAMVIDREYVYIGSMNFDPRSALYNTEMGAFIRSNGLGEELAQLIERDTQPLNSWQVKLDDDGKLSWSNSEETVSSQPARNWWQRVQDILFQAVPKEYY